MFLVVAQKKWNMPLLSAWKPAMVPGISSSLSVPAAQNIPVTKRGATESFWVITGTTKNHGLSSDVALAAKSNATVVILMGMSKLSQIVALFKKEGKSKMPMAIIQNGTWENEKIGIGTVASIATKVEQLQLSNPAIIIIGEVVRHRTQMEKIKQEITKQEIKNCLGIEPFQQGKLGKFKEEKND